MAASSQTEELPVGLTLEPDYISIPGQRLALVSFVGPEFCRQKSGRFAMKIRGVFDTQDEAKAYVNRLRRSGDNLVDIFLVEVGRWVPTPPDAMQIETQEYQETFLNELMSGYAESQRSAKEVFAERKKKVMQDGLDAHLLPQERLPPPTGPLPAPEKLPKLETSAIEEVSSEEPEKIEATEATHGIFSSDDPWTSKMKS